MPEEAVMVFDVVDQCTVETDQRNLELVVGFDYVEEMNSSLELRG